jgi:hypothetical protein
MGVGLGLDTGGGKNGGVQAGDLYNFFHLIRIEPGDLVVLGNQIAQVTGDVGTPGTAKTVSEVQTLTTATLQGAVKFVGENPANNNEKFEAQFHSVTLKANGDLSLIGDDYTAMTFEGKAEKNTIGFPSCPTGWIRKVG